MQTFDTSAANASVEAASEANVTAAPLLVVAATLRGDTELLCLTPMSVAGTHAVGLGLNAQQHHLELISFIYEHPPAAISLSPTTGPTRGETLVLIHGAYLHGHFRLCVFGSGAQTVAVVPIRYPAVSAQADLPADANCTCTAPSNNLTGAVSLSFVLNGQQYTHTDLTFSYYDDPPISVLSPAAGPHQGSTEVTISGGHFGGGSDRLCKWYPPPDSTLLPSVVRASHVPTSGDLLCRTTPLAAGWSALEVSLNGQQYTNTSAAIELYTPSRVSHMSPNSGPIAGGTVFHLYGSFAWSAGVHRVCRFDAIGATVPASLSEHAPNALVCVSPDFSRHTDPPPHAAAVEISMNGQQFTDDAKLWSFYRLQRVAGLCPVSGPVRGETTLRVSGQHLFQTNESHCRFSSANWTHTVQSSYIDSTTVTCVTPHTNGTSLLRDVLDANLTAGVRLHGAAARLPAYEGVALNSETRAFTVGTLAVDVHNNVDFTIRSFALAFMLTVVPGSSSDASLATGDGLSFSFGDIAHGLVSERGAGLGLRVQLRQFTYNQLRVSHRGRALLTTNVSVPTNESIPVRITVHNAQLSIILADQTLIAHLDLPSWQPQRSWRMVLGARTGASTASHQLRGVHLGASMYDDLHGVAVELGANTQQYTNDSVRLSMLPTPEFGRYSPSTGASTGGTRNVLFGTNLRWGSDYKMDYAGNVVNATYAYLDGSDALWSYTPASALGAAPVRVSMNAQQYHDARTFGFYEEPTIELLSPTTGPVGGGTLLAVSLSALQGHEGSSVLCRFGGGSGGSTGGGKVALYPPVDVAAHPNPSRPDELLCRLPAALPIGPHAFEVSLNGQEFTSSGLNLTVYGMSAVTSLCPSSGPNLGTTAVRVVGERMTGGSHYLCRFGHVDVDATLAAETRPDEMHCTAPGLGLNGLVPLEVSGHQRPNMPAPPPPETSRTLPLGQPSPQLP